MLPRNMTLRTYETPEELALPPGYEWPAWGRVTFPIGYTLPEGVYLWTCRGLATGHGKLRAGEPVEPRSRDVSGAVVVAWNRLRLRDGSETPSCDGDGGVYGPSYLIRYDWR